MVKLQGFDGSAFESEKMESTDVNNGKMYLLVYVGDENFAKYCYTQPFLFFSSPRRLEDEEKKKCLARDNKTVWHFDTRLSRLDKDFRTVLRREK